MQDIVEAHFAGIIRRLNEMGHQLTPEVVALGELTYRDDCEDEDGHHCNSGWRSILLSQQVMLI